MIFILYIMIIVIKFKANELFNVGDMLSINPIFNATVDEYKKFKENGYLRVIIDKKLIWEYTNEL